MRSVMRPAAAPSVVGKRGIVIFAEGGVGRAAVAGDVWEIRYPRRVSLRPRHVVQVVGQGADVLLVLPARRRPQHSLPSPIAMLPRMRSSRRG